MMKTLFILMNHELLPTQYEDALHSLHIEKSVTLSDAAWSQIAPDASSIKPFVLHYEARLKQEAKEGDFLLVQGDFGATYHMVRFAKNLGMIAIYATTKRVATQKTVEGSVITQREFLHVRFREYEEA